MISKLLKSLKYRIHLARYGVYYWSRKDFDLTQLKVRNRRIKVEIPHSEKEPLGYELYSILIEDCYRIAPLKGRVNTVLDVGANIGLFSVSASFYFPEAIVHAYEPNSMLETHLAHNCDCVEASYFLEAVGLENGLVNLREGEKSLHSTTSTDTSGNVGCIAFREALQRLGGRVDLVKLDCEGAEWQIFEDIEAWSNVHYLTMEYHLWASPGYTFENLLSCLKKIGFICTQHQPASDQWGIIQASNQNWH
jgi:FkbM family methyltransferase